MKKEARDDAADLIKTTNLDLTHTRAELFFFLAAVLFVAVTTLSITDRDLLFGSHVQLPILGLSMSFDAFLLGSPLLLLAVHYALLLKFGTIRDKCLAINDFIDHASVEDPVVARSLALKTASNFMAQWLISGAASGFYRHLSSLIYFLSICVAPLFTLLLLTIRTLPLHRSSLTAVHIFVLSPDIALLALFHGGTERQKLRTGAAGVATWIGASLIFCIPDGAFDRWGRSFWPAKVPFASSDFKRTAFAPTAFLLENGLDNATGRPILFFSRNLIVTDDRSGRVSANAGTSARSASGQSLERAEPSFRGRDLRYAILDRSDFRGADFTLADLTGASLDDADLRGATFGCAVANTDPFTTLWHFTVHLNENESGRWVDKDANCTTMTDIKLNRADLRETNFVWGQLSKPSLAGAQLSGANLDGVDLSYMDMSLASLPYASLVGANLRNASLIGAALTSANLTGAILRNAELRLTALGFARLSGADLVDARLVAADLTSATMIGADLGQAVFYGARFDNAILWGATPPAKGYLAWADLTGARIEKPAATEVDVIKASLAGMTESQRNSERMQELRTLIESIDSDLKEAAKTRAWSELTQALARNQEDPLFRNGVGTIITENACEDVDVSRAVEAWSRPDFGYATVERTKRALHSPAADPALKQVADGGFPISELSVRFYPDTVVPLPEWYDLGPLIQRLENGTCTASKDLGQRVLSAMKESHKIRTRVPSETPSPKNSLE